MPDYGAQIEELEKEIRKTQYNKATQHHIGKLKAKIAQLREAQEHQSSKGPSTSGYQVRRSGDATVILLGFPSAGKSTLLNALTNQDSEVGSYAFTTLTVIPGLLEYKGAQIQVLDVPGIVAGAASGKGRGKEVLATMRSADMCIVLLDGTRPEELAVLEKEIHDSGIRLNEEPPDVKIVKKAKDGLDIGRTVRTPELTNEMISDMLGTFRIFNADIVIRTPIDADQFLDVVQGNKKYMPALLIVNKTDLLSPAQKGGLTRRYHPDLFISASKKEGIEDLKERIFDTLGFIRIWMKEPGKEADLDEPLIIRKGLTIMDVARKIHRDLEARFTYARVSGPSAKFPNQRKGGTHTVQDNDIIELHTR